MDAAKAAEKRAKDSFGKGPDSLNVRSGSLRDSIKGTSTLRGNRVIISLTSDSIYARIHEEGGIIRARNHKYMTFQVNGRWAKVNKVRIPPRPFLGPALEGANETFPGLMMNIIVLGMLKDLRKEKI